MATRKVTINPNATDDGVAAELVQLLEVIIADGKITDREVEQLQEWLELNDSDAPAFTFLRTTLDQIVADRVITPAERKILHKAIERILPTELREQSIAIRTSVEFVEKERAKEAKREERIRTTPTYKLNFMVMGVAYQYRHRLIERAMAPLQPVELVREIGNPFDANAVIVRIQQGQVGYVPREYAAELAPLLDSGSRQEAYCTKILQGKRFPIPIVQLSVFGPESGRGKETPAALPYVPEPALPKKQSTGRTCCGCLVAIAALITIAAVAFSR